MLNVVVLQGRVTADPELRYSQSGSAICRFSLAVPRSYVKQGEERQTDFISCKAFGSTGEFIAKWFKKGTAMIAEGAIQSWQKTAEDGQKKSGIEVVVAKAEFCESKKQTAESNAESNNELGAGFTGSVEPF